MESIVILGVYIPTSLASTKVIYTKILSSVDTSVFYFSENNFDKNHKFRFIRKTIEDRKSVINERKTYEVSWGVWLE